MTDSERTKWFTVDAKSVSKYDVQCPCGGTAAGERGNYTSGFSFSYVSCSSCGSFNSINNVLIPVEEGKDE